MNRIYKTVRNRHGQTVVTSELGKSHGKGKTLATASLASLGMISNVAYGAIVVTPSGNDFTISGDANLSLNAPENFVVGFGDTTAFGSGMSNNAHLPNGDLTITNNATITLEKNRNTAGLLFNKTDFLGSYVTINNTGTISTGYVDSHGIHATIAKDQSNAQNVALTINNSGTIYFGLSNAHFQKKNSTGILAISQDDTDITINNTGTIATKKWNSDNNVAISTQTQTGSININHSGVIATHDDPNNTGESTAAILANVNGDNHKSVNISVSGVANTPAIDRAVYGIQVKGNDQFKNSTYSVNIDVADNTLIRASEMPIYVLNYGKNDTNITIGKGAVLTGWVNNINPESAIAVNVSNQFAAQQNKVRIVNHGELHGSFSGFGANSSGRGTLSVLNGDLDVTNTGKITSGILGGHLYTYNAVQFSDSKGTFTNSGEIEGHESAIRISSYKGDLVINNEAGGTLTSHTGILFADSYSSTSAPPPPSVLTFNNSGTLTGYVSAVSDPNISKTFNNNGVWDLDGYNAFENTGSYDTNKRVTRFATTSTIGGDLNNLSQGTIYQVSNQNTTFASKLMGGNTASINQYNMPYLHETNASRDFAKIGFDAPVTATQAHFLRVNNFSNEGIIDLSTKATGLGDVMMFTSGNYELPAGSLAQGSYLTLANQGNSTFVSNGGKLVLDTVLQTHDAQGKLTNYSDVLVVDNARLGTGATKVYVKPFDIGGRVENNIVGQHDVLIVDTLGTNNDAGAFEAGGMVVNGQLVDGVIQNGIYEYEVQQKNNDYYLANYRYIPTNQPNTPNNPNTPNQPNTPQGGQTQVLLNPFMTNVLGNAQMAADMFNHNIYDRRMDATDTGSTLWARTHFNSLQADTFNGQHTLKGKSTQIQMGMDIIQNANINAGLFTGYGYADTKSRSNLTHSKTEGKVKGAMIGAYATYAPEGTGAYLDTWAYYGDYNNELKNANRPTAKYDSKGFSVSAETGVALTAAQMDSGTLVIEPHAQITYNYIDTDNFTDGSTVFSDSSTHGVQTRLGARMYLDTNTVTPFVEANWLHNGMDNEVKVNGLKVDSQIGKNVGEAKVGISGKINDNIDVWGNVAGRFGTDDYRDYGVQLGIGVRW